MGKSQRNKGAGYEREVAHTINETLGLPQHLEVKRNIGQARDGGNDLDAGNLIIECKRRKTLGTIEGWLDQATEAAVAAKKATGQPKYPIVIAREDNGESMVIMRLADFLTNFGDELVTQINAGFEGEEPDVLAQMEKDYLGSFEMDADGDGIEDADEYDCIPGPRYWECEDGDSPQ